MNDGGFYYTIAAGGSSQAGETPDGGLRSYGSMSYAGLKSMIFAGVKKDDPRVKAAHEWITKHYTLDENPGMGGDGLYYYYHTFAKALAALSNDQLVDADGKSHDWSLTYDPTAADGRGRMVVTLDGKSVSLDLGAGDRKTGARFDRFGLVTTWIDGNAQRMYFDDLTYTCGQ